MSTDLYSILGVARDALALNAEMERELALYEQEAQPSQTIEPTLRQTANTGFHNTTGNPQGLFWRRP